MEIYSTPKILLFHLKRFKDSQKYFKSKLQTLVEFPINDLDLKNHVINKALPQEDVPIEEPQSLIYDLFAVCNHFGCLGGGHYTAYCKNHLDGKWYNFDDAIVNEV
jgi:ubiquitin carboxyl-terminal hydrolase 4/11/15